MLRSLWPYLWATFLVSISIQYKQVGAKYKEYAISGTIQTPLSYVGILELIRRICLHEDVQSHFLISLSSFNG